VIDFCIVYASFLCLTFHFLVFSTLHQRIQGEVKVQLDCEYTLRVKLVDAGDNNTEAANIATNGGSSEKKSSGSESPEQLLALCQALLLHAQERYHVHSVRAGERLRKRDERELEEAGKGGGGHARRKTSAASSPRILQSCISLGSKLLFERRIRAALKRVNGWLVAQQEQRQQSTADPQDGDDSNKPERLEVEWLSLSVFDLHAQFALSFRSWVADAHLVNEELTVTSTDSEDEDEGVVSAASFRKVKFNSDAQFELFLKLQLERLMM